MGACVSKKHSKTDVNEILDRQWMKDSRYIDKFVYETSTKLDLYLKIQLMLTRSSLRLDVLPTDQEEDQVPSLNVFYVNLNKELIIKGVPNSKMSQFLYKCFNMKANLYSASEDMHFTQEENEKLKGIDKSYFGRNKVTSNFLNTKGIAAMSKILYKIREEFPNLQYCPVLPRVVQLFLWYLPEKVVLKMIVALLDENSKSEAALGLSRTTKQTSVKYFSTHLKYSKTLKAQARALSKNIVDKKHANKIIEDLIDNMCVQVLPTEYISLVFTGYLVSGISFLTNLSGLIYSLFSQTIEIDIEQIKKELPKANIYNLILKSHQIQENQLKYIDSSDSKFSEMYSTYVPMLDKPSKILTSNEKNLMYSMIPKVHIYSSMRKVFSFEANGLLIQELDYFWRKTCLASLLLIEAEGKVFGIFFDREVQMIEQGLKNSLSVIFVLDKNLNPFQHLENQDLVYVFNRKSGIVVGDPGLPTLQISASLLELKVSNEVTFGHKNDDVLPEGEFDISNIELFLMK